MYKYLFFFVLFCVGMNFSHSKFNDMGYSFEDIINYSTKTEDKEFLSNYLHR